MLLAWKARPGSWHGVAAAATLGLTGGFRQTSLIVLFPLALVGRGAIEPNAPGVDRVPRLPARSAIAVWFVPMVLEQPGGYDEISYNNRLFWDASARADVALLRRSPTRVLRQRLAADRPHGRDARTGRARRRDRRHSCPVPAAGRFRPVSDAAVRMAHARAAAAGRGDPAVLVLRPLPLRQGGVPALVPARGRAVRCCSRSPARPRVARARRRRDRGRRAPRRATVPLR